ncbi:MAG: 50S ribosomal protein L11 methyltransferase [Clostridiales bacterium]|jgi:ribosomal protein L11 methyltransferase|nr:50S ribosomal protein L11 methyltransferase [Clostridiales bacterium]
MDWTEVAITVDAKDVDKAGDIAQMVVPYGIYIEDYSNLEQEAWEIAHIDLIDEELLKKDRTKGIIHVYISPEESPAEAIAFLSERYTAEQIPHTITTADCVMEDWINNWKKYFKPIEVGHSILIRPTWEEDYDAKGRRVLHLEPGLAFGTGTHETTRLCIELIEDYLRPQMDILDVGCGSGILSVAALLMGGQSAVGVDIDELAVKTAVENAKINQVDSRFTAIAGNLTEKVQGKFHMIVANIVADIIIELTQDIEQFMYDDTVYIMSGIIDTREQDVLQALEKDFEIIDRRWEKGWVALAAQKKRRQVGDIDWSSFKIFG